MNKSDLVERVAEATGEAKTRATELVDATFGAVQAALAKGEKVVLPGFGTFTPRPRKARTGRNPRTGAAVKIPATTIPVFKAGQALKDLVSGRAKLSVTRTSSGKKSSAKKTSAKAKATAKKTTAKKSPAKKTSAKAKTTAKKSTAKAKSSVKKSAAKAKKTSAKAKSKRR